MMMTAVQIIDLVEAKIEFEPEEAVLSLLRRRLTVTVRSGLRFLSVCVASSRGTGVVWKRNAQHR